MEGRRVLVLQADNLLRTGGPAAGSNGIGRFVGFDYRFLGKRGVCAVIKFVVQIPQSVLPCSAANLPHADFCSRGQGRIAPFRGEFLGSSVPLYYIKHRSRESLSPIGKK